MALQIFPHSTLKVNSLAERMHYFCLHKKPSHNFNGIKAFVNDEERRSLSPSLTDWLFSKATHVIGISDNATYNENDAEDQSALIYAVIVVVDWPCRINGEKFLFAPLVLSVLDTQSYSQLLLNYAAEQLKEAFIFPGDTILRAPRLMSSDCSQRLLKYSTTFSKQKDFFQLLDLHNPDVQKCVQAFFVVHSTSDGLDWNAFDCSTLSSTSCLRVAALYKDGEFKQMAVLQVDRKDGARILWYANISLRSNNNLKFLKAISANLKQNLMMETSSSDLFENDAIMEETVEDDNAEYALFQSRQEEKENGKAAPYFAKTVALPCFI